MKMYAAVLIACLCIAIAQAQYGGSGTREDPYRIYTAEQMNEIGLHEEHWSGHFKLMADLDLEPYGPDRFNCIGDYGAFTGLFDGNGHSIANFHYAPTNRSLWWTGLFSMVSDPNAVIKDLELIDPNVTGLSTLGPLVGWLWEGTITNCHVRGGNVQGPEADTGQFLGGLVGSIAMGTVANCSSSSTVTGSWYVGGLAGNGGAGIIENCCATGDVTGRNFVGGLAGGGVSTTAIRSYATGQVIGRESVGALIGMGGLAVTDCCATGSVTAEWACGGLIGYPTGNSILNCYATGAISVLAEPSRWSDTFGGLLGLSYEDLPMCFWDIEASGWSTPGAGIGLPTTAMKQAATFIDAGWDFVGESENGTEDVWTIDEGQDYPRLAWQRTEQP